MKQEVIQKAEERPKQRGPNLTGIPTQMKLDFEQRSGLSFDDVRVHYNSDKPRKIRALAYTQIPQVHIGPGQERHLRHELGHVVQQKNGIVSPTLLINGGRICTNPDFEKRADSGDIVPNAILARAQCSSTVIQGKFPTSLTMRLGFHLNELLAFFEEALKLSGVNLKQLVDDYQSLPDTLETRDVQLSMLDKMMRLLNQMLPNSSPYHNIIERMMGMITQEQRFIMLQYPISSRREDIWVDYAWRNMDDSAFTQAMKNVLGYLSQSETRIDYQGFTTEELVATLSNLYYAKYMSETCTNDSVQVLYRRILVLLMTQGELVHYSHMQNLNEIVSTDRLKIDGMFANKDSYDLNPQENQVVSKSQHFDVEHIKNSGFVFMFIERRGTHRSSTRFGSIRYSIPIAQARPYLNRAWAITHDIGGTGASDHFDENAHLNLPHPFDKKYRIVETDLDKSIKISDIIISTSREGPEPPETKAMESIMAAYTEQKVSLGEKGAASPALIAKYDFASGYLYGERIIGSIALRAAIELGQVCELNNLSPIKLSDDVIWQYITEMIHDFQVMIPQAVSVALPSSVLVETATETSKSSNKPSSLELPRMEIRSPSDNIFYYEDLAFPINSNPSVPGHCFWNLLKKNGIKEDVLKMAAQKAGITYNDFVDINQINNFLNVLNTNLSEDQRISIDLTVFTYSGEVLLVQNRYGSRTMRTRIIRMGLVVAPDGNGHYIEATRA